MMFLEIEGVNMSCVSISAPLFDSVRLERVCKVLVVSAPRHSRGKKTLLVHTYDRSKCSEKERIYTGVQSPSSLCRSQKGEELVTRDSRPLAKFFALDLKLCQCGIGAVSSQTLSGIGRFRPAQKL